MNSGNAPRLVEVPTTRTAREVVMEHAANELVVGVVGHVGSGNSEIARQLKSQLEDTALYGGRFDTEILKASDEIRAWATGAGLGPGQRVKGQLTSATVLQDLGDRCRRTEGDASALARYLVQRIRLLRAKKQGIEPAENEPVVPDGTRRAWIVDSLRHPNEVALLRHIYQEAFVLVGVVCDEGRRHDRLRTKYDADGSPTKIAAFMERDADDSDEYGQKVADTFHVSDYFVDNTENRLEGAGIANVHWDVPDQLGRLIKLLTHAEIVRPSGHEMAMHIAYGAQLRSACLSRQVGAALVASNGELLATGTNEVPRPGGGVYGQTHGENEPPDDRCAFRRTSDYRYCSNTREQLAIVNEVVDTIVATVRGEGGELSASVLQALPRALRKSRIGGLLEFSRAVHAEMGALLSAGKTGHCPHGATLYVTTFPCHYCARHLVAAGVVEVQYIEPYPKSLATKLHDDSISTVQELRATGGTVRKVIFRHFTGVAPRLYRRAFLKERDLKDATTGSKQLGTPVWGTPWHLRGASYVTLEAELSRKEATGDRRA